MVGGGGGADMKDYDQSGSNEKYQGHLLLCTLFNLRGRSGLLPQLHNCFGNFCTLLPAKFIPSNQQNKIELLHLVTLIDEAIAEVLKDSEAAQTVDDVLSSKNNLQKELTESSDFINGWTCISSLA